MIGARNKRKQLGQSMTEFVVVASTVLVPLFMVIPILGKYSDVNMMTPQAARYMAWERTVWHDSDETLSNGLNESLVNTFPKKGAFELRQEVPARFMGHALSPIDSIPNTVLGQNDLNPLWVDGTVNDLVSLDTVTVSPHDMQETPTWLEIGGYGLYDAFEFFNDGINILYDAVDFLGGTANFTPNYSGYYAGQNDTISVPIQNPDYILSSLFNQQAYYASRVGQNIETININFSANASVLADTWNTQGSDHFRDQTAGLVPMGLVRGTVLEDLFEIASTILFEPNLYPGEDGLDLGGFNTDPFNLEHENGSQDYCDSTGFCSFNREN